MVNDFFLIFSRQKNAHIELRGSLREYKTAGLSPQLPLLSYLAITYKDNLVINDVLSWFDNRIVKFDTKLDLPTSFIPVLMLWADQLEIKQIILDMLKEMNIDIDDYRIENKAESPMVFTKHTIKDKSYELSFEDESDGTLKLLEILPFIVLSLTRGATFLVDELDSKLHPKLLQYIISLYNDKSKNPKVAQLIFTSHDLATMNNQNFRRDEVWFVAKGADQGSVMYSLVEIKESGIDSYSEQYLKGKYGADPYLQKIINWEEIHEDTQKSKKTT